MVSRSNVWKFLFVVLVSSSSATRSSKDCQLQCLENMSMKKIGSAFTKEDYIHCMVECPEDRQSPTGEKSGKGVMILEVDDQLPSDLVMTEEIPPVPQEVYDAYHKRISKESKEAKRRSRKSNKETECSGMLSIEGTNTRSCVLSRFDPLPSNLATPSRVPLPPKAILRGASCKSMPLPTKPSDTMTNVLDLTANCETQGNTSTLYAHWKMPNNAKRYTGFQVHYTLVDGDAYSPVSYCIEVEKDKRTVRVKEGLRENVTISIGVVPLPLYDGQQVKLGINLACGRTIPPSLTMAPSTEIVTGSKSTQKEQGGKKSANLAMIIGGIGAALFAMALGVIVLHRMKKKNTPHTFTQGIVGENGPLTYFSHCFGDGKNAEKLLSLVARLNCHYGIPCTLDLLEQRVIDLVTLPVWCNRQLAKADKIVVVLCSTYYNAWKDYVQSPDANCETRELNILKILNDMVYIQQHLMERGGRNAKVICLLSGVDKNSLPAFLKMRPVHQWPQPGSEEELNFVRCLVGEENRTFAI